MSRETRRNRRRLGAVVLAVLISQVLLYPGVPTLTVVLGAPAGIDAGMWFLVAEFAAFVTFAVVWGVASDTLGRRVPLIVVGALGGACSYLALSMLPTMGANFETALVVRAMGGAFTIGAFSLAITTLMDLDGGHGRNMGVAGLSIGLGAATGSVAGGVLADLSPFYPVYAGAGMLFVAALLVATVEDDPDQRVTMFGDGPNDTEMTGDGPPGERSFGGGSFGRDSFGDDSFGGDSIGDATVGTGAPGLDPADRVAAAGTRPDDGSDSAGFRDVLARIRATPSLLVPFAFGFVDRLTAGFFSLVGVYYFQDASTFGLSATGAGLTLALFFIPFAVLQAPFGALSDRIGRYYPIVFGSIAYGVVIVGVGVAPTYAIAAGLMVLVGVCGAFMAPATMALVTDLADADARGAAMGLFNVFGSLGFLAGFLVGGGMTGAFGYLPAFLAVGGLELAIALVLLPAVRRVTPRNAPDR